jgi:hypothetical protein
MKRIKRFILDMLIKLLRSKNASIAVFRAHKEKNVFPIILRIIQRISPYSSDTEMFHIASLVLAAGKVEGDIAEVGVAYGATAKIISTFKGNKELHLFDTFDGIPFVSDEDDPSIVIGDCKISLEVVQKNLEDEKNIRFYKGTFPITASSISDRKFALVHLDVDIYQSTKDALNFFYPRLNKGGILFCHDYSYYKGVKKAVDEFFADKPEPVIALCESQCLTIKL